RLLEEQGLDGSGVNNLEERWRRDRCGLYILSGGDSRNDQRCKIVVTVRFERSMRNGLPLCRPLARGGQASAAGRIWMIHSQYRPVDAWSGWRSMRLLLISWPVSIACSIAQHHPHDTRRCRCSDARIPAFTR